MSWYKKQYELATYVGLNYMHNKFLLDSLDKTKQNKKKPTTVQNPVI